MLSVEHALLRMLESVRALSSEEIRPTDDRISLAQCRVRLRDKRSWIEVVPSLP